MNKVDLVFIKLAQMVEDNRPEPGYWARQMAGSRAIRRSDTGAGKLIASNEVIGGRLISGLKGMLIGAGIGAAALGGGTAGAKILGKLIKSPRLAEITMRDIGTASLVGGIPGALVGDATGKYKFEKKYLKDKGIDLNVWGVQGMSSNAKKKYLLDKYRGGGYKVPEVKYTG